MTNLAVLLALRLSSAVGRLFFFIALILACATTVDAGAQSFYGNCKDGTGNIYNATVIFPNSGTILVDGVPLSAGSEIAVFSTDPAYPDLCVGSKVWEGRTDFMIVWGDDELTRERDGLRTGEPLSFRIWDRKTNSEYLGDAAKVQYLMSEGVFAGDANFILTDLSVHTAISAPVQLSPPDSSIAVELEPLLAWNPVGGAASYRVRLAVDSTFSDILFDGAGIPSAFYQIRDLAPGTPYWWQVSVVRDGRQGAWSPVYTFTTDKPPRANNDRGTTQEDRPVIVDILFNDFDEDGAIDPATVVLTSSTPNGSVTNMNPITGAITYAPDPDFNGEGSFTYVVNDRNGFTSNTANVRITIRDVNDPPIAVDDSVTVGENQTIRILPILNDRDVDGSLVPSTILIVEQPILGVITEVDMETGAVSYFAPDGSSGTDTFMYSIQDDDGAFSDTASVHITINDANSVPVALSDEFTTDEDLPVDMLPLANDNDPDGYLVVSSFEVMREPAHGVLSPFDEASLVVTYSPAENFSGEDTFTYRIRDNKGSLSAEALVTITITEVNDPPVAFDDERSLDEDSTVSIDLLLNDSDIDDVLNPASVRIVTEPENGALVAFDSLSGSVTYQPSPGFNGSDAFQYTVSDVRGAESDTATVKLSVTSVNDAPIATSDAVSMEEDGILLIDVLSNDTDPDGDALRVAALSDPSSGTVSIDSTGLLLYSPDPDYFGTDRMTYSITDGNGGEDQAELVIEIEPVNDAPTFVSHAVTSATAGILYRYEVQTEDVDTETLSINLVAGPEWLTIVDHGDKTATLAGTPGNTDTGAQEITLQTIEVDTAPVLSSTQQFELAVDRGTQTSPIAVVPIQPADGALNVDVAPTFSWQAVSGVSSYHLQITDAGDPTFTSVLFEDSTLTSSTFSSMRLSGGTRYSWRLRARSPSGIGPWSTPFVFTTINDNAEELPTEVRLFQNYPNPFNPSTTIVFELPESEFVELSIFDVLGHRITTLVQGSLDAGRHQVRWQAGDRSSGLYFFQLRTDGRTITRSLSLMK